jgi:hypothetical protein
MTPPKLSGTVREGDASRGGLAAVQIGEVVDGEGRAEGRADSVARVSSIVNRSQLEVIVAYSSALFLCHATDPSANDSAELANARGSTSSMTLERRHCSSPSANGSRRQSATKMEPRQSATRNSLLEEGWAQMEVSGWAKLITYAVG